VNFVDYPKLVETIPSAKWHELVDALVDAILTTKNDDKMPPHLANTILHEWQLDTLETAEGLVALLEASVLLEPEKTLAAAEALQLVDVAQAIKQVTPPKPPQPS
jgi:hypothetical protein